MVTSVTYAGGTIFDGMQLHSGQAARWHEGRFAGLVPEEYADDEGPVIDLAGTILAPGYTDLQVNGGDGLLLNDDPSPETLVRISRAHRQLGTVRLLPTLITDCPEITSAALEAAKSAMSDRVPGVAGLHLEGPHLSLSRKGAHDGAMIRPMTATDLEELIAAKNALPVLKVTVAPENVSLEQVAELADAGILVSLGHTDADFDTCMAYAKAGARCVTHLFNAMSQMGSRTPGLVGAALTEGALSAGLIADGIHVHPATMRAAWRSKTGPGRLFLVSDAMAVAGTDQTEFRLGGRKILRRDGRLTLEDGTLAGADLDLTRAIHVLVADVGLPLEDALRAAITTPAELIGQDPRLAKGVTQLHDMIRIAPDLSGASPVLGPGNT